MIDKEKLKFQQFYNYLVGRSEIPMGYKPAGDLSMEEAFKVYADGYTARLTEALGETYETIWKFVGDEIFFEICADFIQKNPSKSYNLSDYGPQFPEYLLSLPAHQDYPFLSDLARFELNRHFLFHQRYEEGTLGTQVQSQLKEDSRLSFVSSFAMIHSNYDITKIWKLLQNVEILSQNKEENEENFDLSDIEQYEKHCTIMIFKDEDTVRWVSLSSKAYFAINNLTQGQPLTEALKELQPEEVTELFKNLMLYRLIRDVV